MTPADSLALPPAKAHTPKEVNKLAIRAFGLQTRSMEKENPRSSEGESLDEEILALHAAIDHESLWRGVLGLLRKATSSRRITLFLGHLGMAEARIVFTDPPINESGEWYRQRARVNPFSAFIEAHVGRPYYHFHEVIGPPEAFRKTAFYDTFARKEDWDKGLSIMFWNKEEMRAMFSLYRGSSDDDFTEEERDFLLGISRHIEIAIIRVQKINREETFRTALQRFLRTLPAPVLLLDWDLKTVYSNLAAHESAAIWNLGAEKAASLNPRECFRIPAEILAALKDLKAQYSRSAREEPLPDRMILSSPLHPESEAHISVIHTSPSPLARPGFVIIFREPLPHPGTETTGYRDRALQLLTPAERRIVQEVCAGKRNREIAESLNKSVLTVKTQMNSIFQKLNLRSRGELIARLR